MGLIATSTLLILFVTLGLGIWVSISLFTVGIGGLALFKTIPVDKVLAQNIWNMGISPELLALPLFILMAEILFRTRLSDMLLKGLVPWTTWLPGRLLHVNVMSCTLFAAVCGSSAATTATVGRITLSELLAQGYNRSVVIGSLAGAGTLGFLIPPSIIMIIYGVLAETSILKLFIAGIIPGLLLALSFIIFIAIRAIMNPSLVPQAQQSFTWAERWASLRYLLPVVVLIVAVIGSMYAGIASPTEAAAVGALGALGVSAFSGSLTWENLKIASLAAVRTTSMIGLIIAGAGFLSVAMGYLGVPRFIAAQISALDLSPFGLILLLVVFYIALGCVLDGLSAIVMTLPITLPLVTAAGFDPIWFGVFLVLVVEMAQVTPPVGFNLFVIQGLTSDSIWRIGWVTAPFCLIMVGMTLLITLFPEIVTFVPNAISFR